MTDILDLPGWKALSISTEDGRLVIEGEYTRQPDACQLCGVIGALYKHGPRAITFMDSPVRGRSRNNGEHDCMQMWVLRNYVPGTHGGC